MSFEFDLYTIGHSNLPGERFLALVGQAGITAIADVRSVPFSRRFPWFSGKTLAARLQSQGIVYLPMGDTLGGRPRDTSLYCDGIADYEAMAAIPEFEDALGRLLETARSGRGSGRVCIMCAEREPLDCHRCLLIGRALAARRLKVGHILVDGTIEPHARTEERLLNLSADTAVRDLFQDRTARLADAYRRRAHTVAARSNTRTN